MLDTPNVGTGGSASGVMTADAAAELRKALTAGYGTDMNTLTGGAALRIQSLDPVMQATIQETQHFKLFNRLAKTKPTATVDEWTEQSGIGGFLGGTSNGETGVIQSATGTYARRTGMVKYLMTRREVSVVQTFQNAIADSEAVEYANGSLQLLSDAEYFMFEGNDQIVDTEFSGIRAQLEQGVAAGQVDPGNIIDLRGVSLDNIAPLNRAAAQSRSMNNFGTSTDVFWNVQVQADMDNALDPAFRVPVSSVGDPGIRIGSPVVGIRTSGGQIATNEDIFIPDQSMRQPFEVRYPVVAAINSVAGTGFKPASVTGVAASEATSQFAAGQAGLYYYAVAGINSLGQSEVVLSSQITVAAGDKVTLTITKSTGGSEQGYVVYRSRKGGGNSVAGSVVGEGSDFREIGRVKKVGATTTFVDTNANIPGTTEAYVLNLAPSATAITWRQFLPMFKFPLAAVNSAVIPWAQILAGYLRITKRRHHVLIKNVLPTSAVWRPFG
jgi:hypothetical protein